MTATVEIEHRARTFAKLVEAHGVSFISVSHAFNTTMSMAPLTLRW